MIRKPGDLPDLAEQSLFAYRERLRYRLGLRREPMIYPVQSLSRIGDGDFSFGIRKFQSAAPAL